MRILASVNPTAEQLAILSHNKPGVLLLRGAAGSGKTTTALLRLRQQCREWLARRDRLGQTGPVRVLVLTYNRTLEGYIAELAREQVDDADGLELTIGTFGKWSRNLVVDTYGVVDILDHTQEATLLRPLIRPVGLEEKFGLDEVEYLLGKYPPSQLDLYRTEERTGRGQSPRIDGVLKGRIVDEVIKPYNTKKNQADVWDWNDIAVAVAAMTPADTYDVVIVDEAQDFSANQMRAVMAHLSDPFSMTLVMDTAQRIYPRSFTWKDVGITLSGIRKLEVNHRNTCEIAAFARSLLEGVPVEDDGTLPDLNSAMVNGPIPVMLEGKYSGQLRWALEYLDTNVTPGESVAFLQVLGGGWFSYLRDALRRTNIDFCELTRRSDWPTGPESVALVTFHSAKGLEFDHVLMLGLNQQLTPHGAEAGDATLEGLRRLVAMGVGRARKSVVVGYKASDASTLISLFDPTTYVAVRV